MNTNQKQYPLWQQFVDRQSEWIGGILTDEDSFLGGSTKIKGIHIDRFPAQEATEDRCAIEAYDSFRVEGEGFDCSFNTQYGGISPTGEPNMARFVVPAGSMSFTITKP